MTTSVLAVLFDFGGVLTTSPFQAFARYERAVGLPEGFLRRLNSTDADTNAWARLERAEIDVDTFVTAYAAEAREAGGAVDPLAVLAALQGDLVPEMVEAVRRLRAARLRLGLLTNNFPGSDNVVGGSGAGGGLSGVVELFDVVVESALEGVRKPEQAAYLLACERLGVAPDQVVFLDDLGVNLKPARALGMTTIKVVDHADAIAALADVVGLDLR